MTDSDRSRAWTGWEAEPADPDTAVAPWPAANRRTHRREQAAILFAIAAGGVIGAAGRYGASLRWPTPAGTFPWATFWVNIAGCGLMGILMILVTERFSTHPLVRPFLGTGVLGGFTTFSTYTVETQRLLQPHTSATALLYMCLTLAGSVSAVWVTATLTRLLTVDSSRRRL